MIGADGRLLLAALASLKALDMTVVDRLVSDEILDLAAWYGLRIQPQGLDWTGYRVDSNHSKLVACVKRDDDTARLSTN